MQGKEDCLSIEEKDLLLWAAKNGHFLSSVKHNDIETVCKLVASGHLYKGQPLNNEDKSSIEESYYSITKKGFSVLECNFLWETYNETELQLHIIAHVNESKLDCEQNCLHKRKKDTGEVIKVFRKVNSKD